MYHTVTSDLLQLYELMTSKRCSLNRLASVLQMKGSSFLYGLDLAQVRSSLPTAFHFSRHYCLFQWAIISHNTSEGWYVHGKLMQWSYPSCSIYHFPSLGLDCILNICGLLVCFLYLLYPWYIQLFVTRSRSFGIPSSSNYLFLPVALRATSTSVSKTAREVTPGFFFKGMHSSPAPSFLKPARKFRNFSKFFRML